MSDDLERLLSRRVQYLVRASDLTESEAEALAWREHGYSHSAIARKIESTTGTVSSYLDRVAAQYGYSAVLTKPSGDHETTDLKEPTREDIMSLDDKITEWWLGVAQENPEHTPDWFDSDTQGDDER